MKLWLCYLPLLIGPCGFRVSNEKDEKMKKSWRETFRIAFWRAFWTWAILEGIVGLGFLAWWVYWKYFLG